jgi:AcrR family transcriptional regulator
VTASPGSATGAPTPQERILAATAAQIRRAGVREVRVQAVAAEAGVSTPLVYHYFGNRAGLVRAALAAAVATAPESTVAGGPVSDTPADASSRDRLVALLAGPVDDAPERREAAAMRNELAASALFDPELAALLAADTARREAAVVAVLRRPAPADVIAAADGAAIGDDAAAVARGLVGLADGLVERWLGGLLTAERTHALVARAVDAVVAR